MLKFWGDSAPDSFQRVIGDTVKTMSPSPVTEWVSLSSGPDLLMPNPGDVILCIGQKAVDRLKKAGVVPKSRTIASLRGKTFKHTISHPYTGEVLGHGYWMVSYSPGIVMSDVRKAGEVRWDVRLAHRLHETGSLEPEYGDYAYTKTLRGLLDDAKRRHEKTGGKVPVALDLETMGLFPWYPGKKIVTLQATSYEGAALAVYCLGKVWSKQPDKWDRFMSEVEELLTAPYISLRGANLKFDLLWIRVKWGLKCTNFTMDTTVVGSLLDENRSNGLSWHAKEYTSLGGYDELVNLSFDKGKMEAIPPDQLLPYAAGDADATLRVSNVLSDLIFKNPELLRFYVKLLHPAVRAFEDIEFNGLVVDPEAYAQLEKELEQEIKEAEEQALALMPARLKSLHAGNLSLSRAQVIKDFMFSERGLNLKPKMTTEKSGESSTSKEHLMMFHDVPEAELFIDSYSRWTAAKKMLSTYVHGFMSHLRPDGRFHPTYFLFQSGGGGGTVTGRLSARDPSIQCCEGSTLVATDKGPARIDWLVKNNGAGRKVLTHTGEWKPIIGVYENGVHPVYRVLTKFGQQIIVTGNHPILTAEGWAKTEDLKAGDTCYELRSSNSEVYQSHVLQLDSYEEQVSKRNLQRLGPLWEAGDTSMRTVDVVCEFSGGYGREAGQGLVDRQDRCERGLRTEELSLGNCGAAGSEPNKYVVNNVQGEDANRSGVGSRIRDFSGTPSIQARKRVSDGGRVIEKAAPELGLYAASEIVSVELIGTAETYDLTIEGSHSFVGNGIVVHNTLPKHTFWSPKLRKCFPAPPGHVFFEADFSQGELRITACVANEETMLQAYVDGKDLHALTGAKLSNTDFDEFMSYKGMFDPTSQEQCEEFLRFKKYRQRAKACIAEGSLVLTNEGLVPIENLGRKHLLWDGEAWGSHGGLVDQGVKEVIEYDGVVGTEDHVCFTEGGREIPLGELASEVSDFRIARTAVGTVPLRYSSSDCQVSRDGRPRVRHIGKKRTFDIANAGPRNRFTVSGRLVHNCNFGLLYGMGALGYQAYAKASYGVDMSEEEAVSQRNAFFELYPRLVQWHNTYRNFARKTGYVTSPLGRVRHLPLVWSKDQAVSAQAERQAINSPIQATLSDLCLWAITELQRGYADKGLWIAGMTHDSLYGYFPEDSPIYWPREITGVMSNLPIKDVFGWDPQIPFPADIAVGPNMADLEELELAC